MKGHLLGILNVDSFTADAYDEATGETVAAFANQAAIAIENAHCMTPCAATLTNWKDA